MKNELLFAISKKLIMILFLLSEVSFSQLLMQGEVVTDDNAPVRNANILVFSDDDYMERYNTTTDENGKFSIIITQAGDDFTFPSTIKLQQNYPNPFSDGTIIPYELAKRSSTKLNIFNVLGQKLVSVELGTKEIGKHNVVWNGKDMYGQTVARGIYFYQLVTGEDTQVKKMIHSSAFSRADGINGGLFKTRTFSNLSQMLNTTTYSIEITSNHSTNPRIKRKEMNYIDVDDGVELSFMVSKDFTIGYLLYVGYQKGYIEIYDTEEYKVVDTVNGFEIEPWDIEVIDGGAKIYVCTKRGQLNSTGKIYSVNMETKESKIICNKSSEIFLRSDQTPFVVSEDPFITQRYLGIIDTKTDSIQWIDTLDIYPVGLSSSGLVFGPGDSILYCLNNDYYLFQYNYKLKKIIYEYSNYSFHFNQNLAIDINGSYLYSGVGQTFNLIYDSLYTNFYYSNFNGKIAISKDGSFVATSDPANSYDITVLPSGKIAFTYDLPNSPIQTLVNVSTRAHPSRSKRTDQIYLTDDSKKAFVSNWSKEIFVIDVAEKIISDVIVFNKGYGYGPITLIKKTN